jgi:hypothetical protein
MKKFLFLSLLMVGSMQAVPVYHINEDNTVVGLKYHNVHRLVRELPYDKVAEVLPLLAMRMSRNDGGEYMLDAYVRGNGGGYITGQVLYHATRVAGYSVAGTAAATAATAAVVAVVGTGGAAAPLVAGAGAAASAAATLGAGSAAVTVVGVAAGSAAAGAAVGVAATELVVATSMAGGSVAFVPVAIEGAAFTMGALGTAAWFLP